MAVSAIPPTTPIEQFPLLVRKVLPIYAGSLLLSRIEGFGRNAEECLFLQ